MIDTKIFEMTDEVLNEKKLKCAADIIRDGGMVVFPTETVYGLGASAFSEDAIKGIFKAKGRPQDNPLICHISSADKLSEVAGVISEKAYAFAEKFWPGPLTMVFFKKEIISDIATCGLDTVGVRVPSHPVALKFLELADVPVFAPSANLSGKPSPTKIEHVIADMSGKVDAIVDGGDCRVGIESTVLDMTVTPPVVLRPGGITLEMLQKVDPSIELFSNHAKESDKSGLKSPGLKHRHYAPEAPLFLVDGDFLRQKQVISEQIQKAEIEGKKLGLILTEEMIDGLKLEDYIYLAKVGSREDLSTVAKNLFAALRSFDEVDEIISESYLQSDEGLAIMNRLIRASEGKYL